MVILEKDCPKGSRVEDKKNSTRVLVRRVTVNINDLNQILFSSKYNAHTITPKLEHLMATTPDQRLWLARVLVDDRNP